MFWPYITIVVVVVAIVIIIVASNTLIVIIVNVVVIIVVIIAVIVIIVVIIDNLISNLLSFATLRLMIQFQSRILKLMQINLRCWDDWGSILRVLFILA